MLDWTPQPPYTAEQLLQVIRILRDPENGRCPLWQDTALFLRKKRNLRKNTGKCPYTLAKPQRMRYNL